MKHSLIKSGKLAIAITALFMFQSFSAISQSNFKLDLHKPGTETVKLTVESIPAEKPVVVTVKDVHGNTLFTQKSKEAQYSKLINFANLENGRYYIDLEQTTGLSRKVLVKDKTGLFVDNEALYFQNQVKFTDNPKKLLVRYNSNLNESVTVMILDARGNVLHEVKQTKADRYASLLDLSNLMHGTYSVRIVSDAYSSTKQIQL